MKRMKKVLSIVLSLAMILTSITVYNTKTTKAEDDNEQAFSDFEVAVNEKQTIHLRDAEKCQIVEKRFGPISGKFVLYRGKDTFAEGVQYLNVENFLCGLK